jgi:2-keto-4-pentenoate hydratase/2-oxohepta-3-ene-1,7-dioic acid hydratase in catechol pathway
MKILNYHIGDKVYPGVFENGKIYNLLPLYNSTLDLIKDSANCFAKIRTALKQQVLEIGPTFEKATFKSPVLYPNKLMCVAGNYIEHIKEGGNDAAKQPEFQQAPWLFIVPPSTVMIGHKEPVLLPPIYNKIDYEGELAVVIGKKGKYISASNAPEYIFGYTIFNDVSERQPYMTAHVEKPRDLSFWYKKSFDTFGPCGPYITTKDEIPDPQNLQIRVSVNGVEKQSCHTSQMIFSVNQLIEFTSKFMTLEPGDIISTGTPAGVGMGSGQFMKVGDVMDITIDNLGLLTNQLQAEKR